jgi:hypothetical protein
MGIAVIPPMDWSTTVFKGNKGSPRIRAKLSSIREWVHPVSNNVRNWIFLEVIIMVGTPVIDF